MSEMNKLNAFQLKKMLDIYKYNPNYANQNMKQLLEDRLEQKINEKENKSEDDDYHIFEKAL